MSRKRIKSICRLCGNIKNLCYSHIIPEFCFKPLYDEKGRLTKVSSNLSQKDRFLQKGLREYLLCESCENHFSKWEDYAKEVLFGEVSKIISAKQGVLTVRGIHYVNFKLFLLSLIWRMSISSLDFFRVVQLGPYETKIRRMLLKGIPGDEFLIPCVFTLITLKNEFLPSLIFQPILTKSDFSHVYNCVICGILFSFVIKDRIIGFPFEKISLNKLGKLPIISKEVSSIPFLHEAITEVSHALNHRDSKNKLL